MEQRLKLICGKSRKPSINTSYYYCLVADGGSEKLVD
jgi:hypothetical protein